MAGRKRTATRASSRRSAATPTGGEIYQDMLTEAGVNAPDLASPERPLKRRRAGQRREEKPRDREIPDETQSSSSKAVPNAQPALQEEDGDDEDIEFEDVVIPEPTVQTMELESDDEDEDENDDEDIVFEDVHFGALPTESSTADEPKELELNLTAQKASTAQAKKTAERRKPISKDERDRRAEIHKAHLLCLLSHVARRNHWCNDARVQDYLRPHLTDKMVTYLNPGLHLSQFGRTESLKNGLKQVEGIWRSKFEITERGLRRALWAEDPEQLADYEPPNDMESCLDRDDFREAAKKLQGSRDIGAQLYCALLRSVGVRARLVCSLQPLACVSGAPTLPKPKAGRVSAKAAKEERVRAMMAKYDEMANAGYGSSSSGSTARRRLGHPNATAYNFEPKASPPKPRPTFEAPKRIKESSYPVYWIEILDVGHQKWQPVDPVVTHTFWKPKVLEPPITDKENSLSYVVAFEADGTVKDVTRRYAKAYTAKTRKLRIGNVLEKGDEWWRKVMRIYRRRRPTDLDQIEDNELAGVEAREPMPRNVQDFKDHPIYALERHLRRHEVLVPNATPSGTVSSGSRGPSERIYRRKDVRVARTADKWYRMGREVKPMEIPVKWLPKKVRPKSRFDEEGEEEEDGQGDAGTPIYTEDQTELYVPPRVRNGKVPKNKFGNIDVYVPSMIPSGGVHIIHQLASRAAFVVGVDYAPALTGFQFKGRHGTAVLNGVIVAQEYEAAVRAVIEGFADLEQEVEDERRRNRALRAWRKLLMGLRIREQIWSGVDVEERRQADEKAAREAQLDAGIEDAPSDVTEEFDMVDSDDGGGGFLVE